MIYFLSDFGLTDWYVGQVHQTVHGKAPDCRIIDIFHGLPAFDPEGASLLMARLCANLPGDSIILAVVDPGVGGEREALIVESTGRHFVAPDNGLLSDILIDDPDARISRISWRPGNLGPTFHGRDLFAVVAARLAIGEGTERVSVDRSSVVFFENRPLKKIIHVDHYGNCCTGIKTGDLSAEHLIRVHYADGCVNAKYAKTFSSTVTGPGWLINSLGLVEIFLYADNASLKYNLNPGSKVEILPQ